MAFGSINSPEVSIIKLLPYATSVLVQYGLVMLVVINLESP